MIYKVCPPHFWEEAQPSGLFRGMPVDDQDGFIHFSTAEQLRETLRRHFAGAEELVVLSVNENQLGTNLRWEPSRGGDLFPHLYAPLPTSAVTAVHSISTADADSDPLSTHPEFAN